MADAMPQALQLALRAVELHQAYEALQVATKSLS
jgi:hypothetical protein